MRTIHFLQTHLCAMKGVERPVTEWGGRLLSSRTASPTVLESRFTFCLILVFLMMSEEEQSGTIVLRLRHLMQPHVFSAERIVASFAQLFV